MNKESKCDEEAYTKFGIKKEDIDNDPVLKQAVDKILTYNKEADNDVEKVMQVLRDMLESGKDIFSVYLLLAKCINFTSQVFCKDYQDFMDEVQKAHLFTNDKVMPIFQEESNDGSFDIRSMLFTASSIIEALIWDEASGDIVIEKQNVQASQETEYNVVEFKPSTKITEDKIIDVPVSPVPQE